MKDIYIINFKINIWVKKRNSMKSKKKKINQAISVLRGKFSKTILTLKGIMLKLKETYFYVQLCVHQFLSMNLSVPITTR